MLRDSKPRSYQYVVSQRLGIQKPQLGAIRHAKESKSAGHPEGSASANTDLGQCERHPVFLGSNYPNETEFPNTEDGLLDPNRSQSSSETMTATKYYYSALTWLQFLLPWILFEGPQETYFAMHIGKHIINENRLLKIMGYKEVWKQLREKKSYTE